MPEDSTQSLIEALVIHVNRMDEVVEYYCNEYQQALAMLRVTLKQIQKHQS